MGSEKAQIDTIRKIGEFIEVDVNEEKVNSIIENLFGDTRTFRKGTIDSWREEIPKELQEEMNLKLGKILVEWNYPKN